MNKFGYHSIFHVNIDGGSPIHNWNSADRNQCLACSLQLLPCELIVGTAASCGSIELLVIINLNVQVGGSHEDDVDVYSHFLCNDMVP